MISTVIMLIINLLPQILESSGVISAPIESLIVRLGAALPGLITSLAQGKGTTDTVMTVLAGIKTEIGVLRDSGKLAPDKVAIADSLEAALANALEGYTFAQTTTDPSTLTDLPEDLTPAGIAT